MHGETGIVRKPGAQLKGRFQRRLVRALNKAGQVWVTFAVPPGPVGAEFSNHDRLAVGLAVGSGFVGQTPCRVGGTVEIRVPGKEIELGYVPQGRTDAGVTETGRDEVI